MRDVVVFEVGGTWEVVSKWGCVGFEAVSLLYALLHVLVGWKDGSRCEI